MNTDLFNACYALAKRRGTYITHREFSEAVLTLYLEQIDDLGEVAPASKLNLTDDEKTARFERALGAGVEAVDYLGARREGAG